MEILCTRPTCPQPQNQVADLDNRDILATVPQKFCTTCGMPLIVGGRYLPERLLGRGGFGAAFLARDRYTPTMRPCVIKLFQPSGDLSPEQFALAQSLFQREAAVLEDLGNRHPQIPDLYAFFPLLVPGLLTNSQEEYFYLVQEFIDGEDFEQILEREGALPTAEVIEVLVSMLKVLDFVHGHNTIHRDIKPSNIMRHRNGLLYLLDFGAVKQVTSAPQASGGKSTGIYSMGFAPPEQMTGGAVYPSTDLYALAVTCILLLTGKDTDALYNAYDHQWAWRSHASVSSTVAAILDRMLLPIPSQRYASAQAVLEALQLAARGGRPAPPPTTSTALQSPPAPPVSSGKLPPTGTPPPSHSGTGSRSGPGSGAVAVPGSPRPGPVQGTAAAAAAKSPPQTSPGMSSISLVEFLGGAAFLGVEGSLLAIALFSLIGTLWLGSGAWLLAVVGLFLLQLRRVIERTDLVIIAGITLALVLLFPPLQSIIASATPRITVVTLAGMAGLAAIAVGTLFRLIYRVLSTFM